MLPFVNQISKVSYVLTGGNDRGCVHGSIGASGTERRNPCSRNCPDVSGTS